MISVVTITFNNFDELMNTVRSLDGAQGNYEHIIIDGGSCQKTKDYLKNTFKGKYISEPDHGIPDAFNKGLKLSTGDGVIFLNSGDTLVKKDYLALADEKLKEYDFVYADTLFEDTMAGIIIFKGFKNFGRGMPYPHQTLVVRKSVFEKVGGFSLKCTISSDYDFVCRMHNSGAKGYYHKESVTLMDGKGSSTTQEALATSQIKEILIRNNLWNPSTRVAFFQKVLFYQIRQLLIALGLTRVLIFLKRLLRR